MRSWGWVLVVVLAGGAGLPAQEASVPAAEPLYEGLGTFGRKVTTRSPEAQRYFDQGLKFLYAFNHDEAIRSFRRAAELDPDCAMAWWGIAVANGPHINKPQVEEARAKAAWEAIVRAREAASASRASAVEKALIEAAARRYADPPPADRAPLDRAYAESMRAVWEAYPNDPDVGALFAESMMDLRPWDRWKHDGTPQPGTEEVVATLERVLELRPDHPLGLHLYIHAVEASPHPEKADAAADRLRDLQPGLGHMVHMPSHIDVRRGRWEQAIVANQKAIAADQAYRAVAPKQGFYRIYMVHNHAMLAFAAMMCGRSAQALAAIDEAVDSIPEDWARENAGLVDGFLAMPLEVRMRFGKWDEILAAPEPPEYFPIARALRHAIRGAAYAAKGRPLEARREQAAFLEGRRLVPEDGFVGNNKAADILDVAGYLLEGEILYREGKHEEAFAALREAVRREDALKYDEPPDWIIPVRHALGAALLQSGRLEEAEQVYRDDLARLPRNGWSLIGLSRCLEMQGKADEAAAVRKQFQEVWREADFEISSSCLCLPGK